MVFTPAIVYPLNSRKPSANSAYADHPSAKRLMTIKARDGHCIISPPTDDAISSCDESVEGI
jgi:hypothetical protein